MRKAQVQDSEQSLVMEFDMLSPANSGAIDVHDLEPQAPRLKAERDSQGLEVYSVDMQGATSERSQSIQTLGVYTNGPTL
jgi:hypothetical protein